MLKKLFSFMLLFFCTIFAFAESYSSQQLIPAGHWTYDALFMLNNETKRTSFATNAPVTCGELKMYLSKIPYEELSDSGKKLYDKLIAFFSEKKFQFNMGNVFAGFNLELNPIVLFKTNDNIDWSFATDYTGHKNSVSDYKINNASIEGNVSFFTAEKGYRVENIVDSKQSYGAASSFYNTSFAKPAVNLPIYLGWGDNIFIQTDPCLTKSFWGMAENDSFLNMFLNGNDMEFCWPRNAYGSFGFVHDDWGWNFNVNRTGLQIGKTQTGSVIYNSTFLTDFYAQLNLYSPRLKYNLDVVQVSTNKYLYLHLIEARPYFDWIRLGIVEGMLIQHDFELKGLNPIMIMHSYGSWANSDYYTDIEEDIYGEAHVAQYMGIEVELTPFKNFRTYFLYGQNEIQPPNEQGSANGRAMPDSFGIQLGFETTVADKNNGWWTGTLEGVYTTPFCYVKQGADWSLYSKHYDMQSKTSSPVCSWIGTPFGPDALGFQTRLGYTKPDKWNIELDYLFVAHGTNSFGLFNNTVKIEGQEYYAYYPSVLRKMGILDDDESESIARTYKLTGVIQYTNSITVKGSYKISEHLNFNGTGTYTFIFNNKNESNEFAHSAEISLDLSYNLF